MFSVIPMVAIVKRSVSKVYFGGVDKAFVYCFGDHRTLTMLVTRPNRLAFDTLEQW